jgi:CxxC-x17-CxxC domain-containing protein
LTDEKAGKGMTYTIEKIERTTIICPDCGRVADVPFKVKGFCNVYCEKCYKRRQTGR